MNKIKHLKNGKLNIFKWIILGISITAIIFTLIAVMAFNKENAGVLFGYKFYTVISDSMKGVFETGDVIASKSVDISELKEDDIITFESIDPEHYGEIITHKIRYQTVYDGQDAFVTYGVYTQSNDEYPVTADKIIGKYQFKMTNVGYIIQFFKTPAGYFTFIFIPFFILILLEGVRFIRLIHRYKSEQQEAVERQEVALEEEKLKTQEIMNELQMLREKLKNTSSEGDDEDESN